MEVLVGLLFFLLCGEMSSAALRFQSLGLLARPRYTEDVNLEILDAFSSSTKQYKPPRPEIKSLHITSEIENRYANTFIISRVANPANVSQEVTFTVIIPESAFISGFAMEIEGKIYKAYVKEKAEAQREYTNAVNRGQAAAHVHQSARDSERFSVSVNVEAQSKVTFNLTYEELLHRDLGVYRHVINLNPGQIVPEMKVDIHIKELRNITQLRANEIQSANEINTDVAENPKAQVEYINPNEAKIHFEADEEEQKRLEKLKKKGEDSKGGDNDAGVAGQFVIEYDVDRDPTGGEVIVNDGYFVHFFAPNDLPPLRKHVLFVLDVSGSMSGRKIQQLKQAMTAILDDLHPHDLFNIIEFSYSVTVRNLDAEVNSAVYQPFPLYFGNPYYDIEPESPVTMESSQPFPATPYYIKKAKAIVDKMEAKGGTNIHDALKTAIEIAKRGVSANKPDKPVPDDEKKVSVIVNKEIIDNKSPKDGEKVKENEIPQPIIIFLTDGEPTVGETRLHKIQSAVNEFNSEPKATIFSLAFGEGADFPFLKKIALANNGFARHIYEAADASAQLRNFYNQISSPLLANVRFIYPPGQVDDQTVTKRTFSNLFKGSELVIAGKIRADFNGTEVEAVSFDGPKRFLIPIPDLPPRQPHKLGSLERLWAYLTIRQLLDEQDIQSATTPQYPVYPDPVSTSELSVDPGKIPKQQPKEKALQLALKYSFVCPLTSLVVVKPNGTSDLNTESANPAMDDGPSAMPYQQSFYTRQFNHAGPPVRRVFAPQSALYMPSLGFAPISARESGPRFKATHSHIQLPPSKMISFPGPFDFKPPTQRKVNPSFAAPGFYQKFSHPQLTTLNVPTFDRGDVADMDQEESSTVQPEDALSSILWLTSVREGDELVLNTTSGTRKLGLFPPNNYTEPLPCRVEETEGFCRPLEQAVSDAINRSFEEYVEKYMCELPGNYAGICSIPSEASTIPVTTEQVTEEGKTLITESELAVSTEVESTETTEEKAEMKTTTEIESFTILPTTEDSPETKV